MIRKTQNKGALDSCFRFILFHQIYAYPYSINLTFSSFVSVRNVDAMLPFI